MQKIFNQNLRCIDVSEINYKKLKELGKSKEEKMKTILQCCSNNPAYMLTFVNDDYVYHVCEICSKFQHWIRNIESKKDLVVKQNE